MSESTKMKRALERLLGREASTEEVQRFYDVKEILGVGEHDSIWTMLLAFGHYEILYKGIPAEIEKVTAEMIEKHIFSLEAQAVLATNHVQASMVEKVSKTADEMAQKAIAAAHSAVTAKTRGWLYVGLLAGIALSGAIGAGGFYVGERMGQRESLAQDVFLKTDDGKAAMYLAHHNKFEDMLSCKGYSIHKAASGTYCIPVKTINGKTINYGWKLK